MDFKKHLEKYLSLGEIDSLLSSLDEKEVKGVYLNHELMSDEEFSNLFKTLKPHPVVPHGFIFDKESDQLGKKVYHEQGLYYIQEPSAMLVSHFLNAVENDKVLDLCAAPGGKTIQAALKMNNSGLIIANDLSKSRANILLSNIERLGISNTVVTSLDFKIHYKKFINYFDKIILDAPCSGSGMFRKMSEMKDDWTYEKVLKNAAIQKDLILMCYEMLKEGGTLVYSTCSYSYEEDEEVIEHLLSNTDATLENIPAFEGEFRSPKYKETVHLLPSHFKGEGHFIALIKKPGLSRQETLNKVILTRNNSTKSGIKQVDEYILPCSLPKDFDSLCLRPGLFKSSKIGNKVIPSHHYSHAKNDLEKIELSKEEVVKYLRGESLNKKEKEGYLVVTFHNIALGLVHSVNGTLKNLYPKGLRINANIDSSF